MRAAMGEGGLVVLALLAGCASTPPPAPPPGPAVDDYVPLEVGHAWTYAVRFPGQVGERVVRITHRDEEGYFVDDAGGALRITELGLRDRDRYLLRSPLEAGQSWRAVVSPSAVERYEILSVGEPCECRAGRFSDCVVVQSRLRRDAKVTLVVRFTWVRGVGLAKVETAAEIAGEGEMPQTEQSLLRYALGGGDREPEAPTAPAGPELDEEGAPDSWGR